MSEMPEPDATVHPSRMEPPGPLTSYLESWRRDYAVVEGQSLTRRLFRGIQGSKWSVAASWVTVLLSLLDATAAHSLHDALPHITIVMGGYSSIFAQVLFWRRRQPLCRCLSLLSAAVAESEDTASPSTKARMSALARRAWWVRRLYLWFGWCTVGMLLHIAVRAPPRWGRGVSQRLAALLPGEASLWAAILYVCNAVGVCAGSLCCLTGFYSTVPLVLVLYSACIEVLRAIGCQLQEGRCVPRWCALQGDVIRASLVADELLRDLLPQVLMATVTMPLVSTIQFVLGGTTDAFALGTAAPLAMVFTPLFEAGDRLAAARASVASRAYEGPWLKEPLPLRQLRLGVMLAARGRGAQARARVFGALDRRAWLIALKSWFSFLQMLLNIRTP